jgi:hypothetical protein
MGNDKVGMIAPIIVCFLVFMHLVGIYVFMYIIF